MAVKRYNGSGWDTVAGLGAQGAAGASGTAPLTTKGDLLSYSTTPDRLGIGANNTVLTADSSTATGLKWASPGMTFISRTSFTNVASQAIDSVFSSSYFSYVVVIEKISAATITDDLQMQMRYGSSTETGLNYNGNLINTTRTSATITNTNQSDLTQFTIGTVSGDTNYISNYTINFNYVGNASERAMFNGIGTSGNSEFGAVWFGGAVHTPRTYTGILLKSSSSNITGAVSVYGLAKA